MPRARIEMIAVIIKSCIHPLYLTIEKIPVEQFNWRPASESRSIKEILLHLLRVDNSFLKELEFDVKFPAPKDVTSEEILSLLKQHHQYLISLLFNMNNDDELFSRKTKDEKAHTINDVFSHIPFHYLYHLSQIIYLRRANDRQWKPPQDDWDKATRIIARYLKEK